MEKMLDVLTGAETGAGPSAGEGGMCISARAGAGAAALSRDDEQNLERLHFIFPQFNSIICDTFAPFLLI